MFSTSDIFVLCASARTYGNTRQVLQNLFPVSDVQELSTLRITPFDYAYANRDDDALNLFSRMVEKPVWILATPIYWYNVSGLMKIFLDRLTDLMYHHPCLYEKLRGKQVAVITSSAHQRPEEIQASFAKTCDYLGMLFQGIWGHVVSPTSDSLTPSDQAWNRSQTQQAQAWWRATIKE